MPRNETPEERRERMRPYYKEYMKKRYHEAKAWLDQYKVDQGCKDCGWNLHPCGLQIDHLESRNGNDNKVIGRMTARGVKVLQRELQNCEVVCSTCHSIRTFKRFNGIELGQPLPEWGHQNKE